MSSPVLWYATRATGTTALLLLTVTVVLGILTSTRFASPRWPRVATQDLHRRIALLTLLFVAGHVLTTVLDTYVHVGWAALVVPFASEYKRWWVSLGTVSLDLLLAVLVTSLLRSRIPTRLWRQVHWLVYAGWFSGALHSLVIGTDMRLTWVLGLAVACILAVALAASGRLWHAVAQGRRTALLASVPLELERAGAGARRTGGRAPTGAGTGFATGTRRKG